jgi:hypothetical protein
LLCWTAIAAQTPEQQASGFHAELQRLLGYRRERGIAGRCKIHIVEANHRDILGHT